MTSSVDTSAKFVIDPARWRSVGTGEPGSLDKARSQMINLVQWLARIANSFVTGGTPDDRILLKFCGTSAAFATKTFDNNLSLELRLPTLEMQFLENGRPMPHILDPEEHSPAEVEAWILVELLHRGVDRTRFSKKLPYSIPDLMSGDEEDYTPRSCQQALAELAAWFQNAAAVLDAAARAVGFGKIIIACWPQTLNLSCVTESESKRTDFGFSPGDAQNPAPFFYRSMRAANGSAGSNKRSILTASTLLAERNPAMAAIAFMTAAAG
jgi:hypothetical protein